MSLSGKGAPRRKINDLSNKPVPQVNHGRLYIKVTVVTDHLTWKKNNYYI